MPHVHRALIELVLSRAGASCDAVGIRIGGLPQLRALHNVNAPDDL
jgi:hypothetical protein